MNILIMKPCCVEDVLLTTPLVATLRAAYPEGRIDYAVGGLSKAAVITNPDIDEVIPLYDGVGGHLRRLVQAMVAAWRLRWRRYDAAFVLDRPGLSHAVAYLAGIPRRFGIGGFPLGGLLTGAVGDSPGVHESEIWLRLAAQAGLKPFIQPELKYLPTQVSLERAVQLLRGAGFDSLPFRFAMAPGGGGGPKELEEKRWPSERYALLANALCDRYGGGVVLLGDEGEREYNFQLRNDIGHPVLDLTGRLDLDGAGAVMQLCDAVIGGDGGPMQLAVAVGTPTVGLFGPSAARRFGPVGKRHRALQGRVWCGPCSDIGGPMENCGAVCMQRITVNDVMSVLEARPA